MCNNLDSSAKVFQKFAFVKLDSPVFEVKYSAVRNEGNWSCFLFCQEIVPSTYNSDSQNRFHGKNPPEKLLKSAIRNELGA